MMVSLDEIVFNLDDDAEFTTTFVELPKRTKNNDENIFRKPSSVPHNQELNKKTTRKPLISDQTTSNVKDSLLINRTSPIRIVKRKFPGPAGLLPDAPIQLVNASLEEEGQDDIKSSKENEIFSSQTSELVFFEPPFQKLRRDFDLDDPNSPLLLFTVDWVKKKAFHKGLKGRRIPFLALVLLSIDCSSADPVITLRDPTGELYGVLHRDVWKEMGEHLRPGAALVVKEVGVLSTGVSRKHVMVNITRNNLVSIYSPGEESEVIVNSVQPATSAQVIRCVNEWQAKARAQSPQTAPIGNQMQSPSASRHRSLFASLSSITTPPTESNCQDNRISPQSSNEELMNSESQSNFDLFSDDMELPNLDQNSFSNNNRSTTSAGFENRNFSGFGQERVIQGNNIILSQAETSMLDEVLSGVDLDDFN